ncbi:MAG: 50S ribosomal protein L28 [Verrucomicrobiae bacterium]|nr:50S ribosomal protein L28 [Verrucomicrobiae bacterium]
MSRVCQITGAKVKTGRKIHRSGRAKKKGGIGRHVTETVKRQFKPNLRDKRVWVPELGKYVRVRVSARGLKTIDKNGAFKTLKEAGLL